LAVAAFVPGGLIKSSDLNSNFSDIATALTQSLATTGVSTMTGPIKAAVGAVGAPSFTFGSALGTGFYLAGANQIGWAANGVQGATFNSDLSTTWGGPAAFSGKVSGTMGTIPVGFVGSFAGSTAPAGWLLCYGQQVSTTTYAALFAVLGTTYGSGAGTFGIPDYRGRADFGQDNMGGSAANRITVAGLNFDGTVLGGTGGGQNQTLTLAQLPTGITSTLSATASSGTSHFAVNSGATQEFDANIGGGGTVRIASSNPPNSGTWSDITSLTVSGTVTSNNTGGTAHTILSPGIVMTKIIYAGT
jgi:microcystin-dependent protein